jgi:hypothetical protein
MAITTLNSAIAGLQQPQIICKAATTGTHVNGRPWSLWGIAGQPAAGSYNTGINGGTYTAPVTGQIPHYDPASGNSYLARFQIALSQNVGTFMLCDRIWDNQVAVNNTTSQSISTSVWPARDVAGGTNGDGILIAIETSAATSATAAVLTNYTYTNQSGTGSRTGNFIDVPTAAATTIGAFFRLSLQGTDTGVRSIQSIQFTTAWTTGTINMVAYRVLAMLDSAVQTSNAIDVITAGFPQIFNGTVPFLVFVPAGTTTVSAYGHYIETQG